MHFVKKKNTQNRELIVMLGWGLCCYSHVQICLLFFEHYTNHFYELEVVLKILRAKYHYDITMPSEYHIDIQQIVTYHLDTAPIIKYLISI